MEAVSDRSAHVGGNLQGSAVVTGDANTVNIHNTFLTSPPERHRQRIPFLLPYLVDRSRQIEVVRQRLMSPPATPRPFLFIVFGDELQSHDMFLRRIEEKVLRRLLQSPATTARLVRHNLRWPENLRDISLLPGDLLRGLSENVQDPNEFEELRTPEEINHRLRNCQAMVTAFLNGEDWREHGSGCVEKFVEFWNAWPQLTRSQQMFVFLSIKYPPPAPGPEGLVARLLAAWRKCPRGIDGETLQSQLQAICSRAWPQLRVELLPPLEGVDLGEAENWARSLDVRRVGAISELLVREIGELFRQQPPSKETTRIPMQQLARHLEALLASDNIREGN